MSSLKNASNKTVAAWVVNQLLQGNKAYAYEALRYGSLRKPYKAMERATMVYKILLDLDAMDGQDRASSFLYGLEVRSDREAN